MVSWLDHAEDDEEINNREYAESRLIGISCYSQVLLVPYALALRMKVFHGIQHAWNQHSAKSSTRCCFREGLDIRPPVKFVAKN